MVRPAPTAAHVSIQGQLNELRHQEKIDDTLPSDPLIIVQMEFDADKSVISEQCLHLPEKIKPKTSCAGMKASQFRVV